ncbi:MAG TPA: VOC family protein [Candidatus Angelobacter sp.]|nr:VOC family protein [Candidatus Angelobacter sp.]
MSSDENNLRIDYIEFPVRDIGQTKEFYARILGWKFEDYGPDYASFHDGRISGGLHDYCSCADKESALLLNTFALSWNKEAATLNVPKPI